MGEIVKRVVYIKGDFQGKYWGELEDISPTQPIKKYSINIYEGTITNGSHCTSEEYDSVASTAEFDFTRLKDISIYFSGIEIPFQEDLVGTFITGSHFKNVMVQGKTSNGEISGKIYAALPYEVEVDESDTSTNQFDQISKSGKSNRPNKRVLKRHKKKINSVWGYTWFDVAALLVYTYLTLAGIGIAITGGYRVVIIAIIGLVLWKLIIKYGDQLAKVANKVMNIVTFGFVMVVLFGIYLNTKNGGARIVYEENKDVPEEVTRIVPDTVLGSQDSIIQHIRVWKDFNRKTYTGIVEILQSDFQNSHYSQKQLSPFLYSGKGNLYKELVRLDQNKLERVYKMMDSIQTSRPFGYEEFAETLVTFVQDIPYVLILEEDCEKASKEDRHIQEILESGVSCLGNVFFGVQSPAAFMGDLKGDCDTRTVFLYALLKKFNYDVVIMNSNVHRHSILGVNISASGNYKLHNGKKYYTWETTSKGWQIGVMPAEKRNMNDWYVAV